MVYLLLVGLVLFGVGGNIGPAFATAGKYMSIIGVVGILLTGEDEKRKVWGTITGGLGVYTI